MEKQKVLKYISQIKTTPPVVDAAGGYSINLKYQAMQKTFFIWYKTKDESGNWKNSNFSCLDFYTALKKLESFKDLEERFPELYKDVSTDFEELLD